MNDRMDDKRRGFLIGEALDYGQSKAGREAMRYFAALMMVEAGRMRLVERVPGDDGTICVFENLAGDLLGVKRPMMSQEREAEILEAWKGIFGDLGLS